VYTSWATERGIEAYEAGRADPEAYGTAVRWFDRAARLNVYEREVPPFDRGDALVGKGDLSGARTSFEEALGLAGDDRRCVVVVNLVLTIELQGDALTAVDELDARPMYAEAEAVIEANRDCLARTTPAGDGEGDRLARAAARLDDKSRVEQPDRRTQTRQDETTDADPVKPGDGDLDELERRLEDNAETRVEGRELDEGLDQGVPPHDGPSW
ncbi:MAG: hypothetical protein M3487_06285, partial [Actinomycetota bacterium]|nr:hypothetical protein [Actinomycetota bacterium]